MLHIIAGTAYHYRSIDKNFRAATQLGLSRPLYDRSLRCRLPTTISLYTKARGGCWSESESFIRARHSQPALCWDSVFITVGFRCVLGEK